jgi:PmbA protein
MVRDVQDGILIRGFLGGNFNSTTGDFSFGIVGSKIEKGETVKPVNEMNISGNATDFWHRLVEVGNDPFPYSSWRVPTMCFSGIHFSGL